MSDLTISLEPDAPEEDVRAVGEGLFAYNRRLVGEYAYETLRFFLRDEGGAVAGGLVADMLMGWMFVQVLWVGDAHRGGGHGSELLRRAEAEARQRGCRGMWLDTFTFQAPEFYRKMGFREFGRIDDFPPGYARHFFMKTLD
ncbi:GNAT family N-acetyltransferase [Longimicrobium sp.]|uniref:GNAT family N-acetyltransferase n=1 Tax=Longimicrobium sp. TaxID=2029185 RepID=UPI002CD02B0D|nr:GNAT family N-acetyltransferase [Longimicrobium sp.]HSU14561.1 GNAT family N-acetyltransferase [Longimicrobium sp.]